MQYTATHCNTLQNAALHGNISYDFEIIVLQCDVECCSMLQHVTCKEQLHVTRRKTKVILRTNRTKELKDKRAAVCCSVLQCVAVCCSVFQCVAVRCSALQCVAVRCSVLQCVAMCCNVFITIILRTHRSKQLLCCFAEDTWDGHK